MPRGHDACRAASTERVEDDVALVRACENDTLPECFRFLRGVLPLLAEVSEVGQPGSPSLGEPVRLAEESGQHETCWGELVIQSDVKRRHAQLLLTLEGRPRP